MTTKINIYAQMMARLHGGATTFAPPPLIMALSLTYEMKRMLNVRNHVTRPTFTETIECMPSVHVFMHVHLIYV